jgi:two-component system phosphate regulon sensor histidine kinase PhoR
MIYNLCDNGINYNKNNGSVVIHTYENSGKIVLSVKDTGIGVAPEHQSRIFERFYRVNKSRSKESGGTGLGLSIVKHGAHLHNAEIQFKSELDAGTEIRILFAMQN